MLALTEFDTQQHHPAKACSQQASVNIAAQCSSLIVTNHLGASRLLVGFTASIREAVYVQRHMQPSKQKQLHHAGYEQRSSSTGS